MHFQVLGPFDPTLTLIWAHFESRW